MEQFKNVLPENFTGVFYFTNPDDEDFEGKWGGKGYLYPSMKTTPMVIMDATPLEIQNIRKKFAKELGERMFFKSTKYETLRRTEGARNENGTITPSLNSIHQANVYAPTDLQQFVDKCLEPLPLAQQKVVDIPKRDVESELSRDEDGEPNTQVVRQKGGLRLKDKEKDKV